MDPFTLCGLIIALLGGTGLFLAAPLMILGVFIPVGILLFILCLQEIRDDYIPKWIETINRWNKKYNKIDKKKFKSEIKLLKQQLNKMKKEE